MVIALLAAGNTAAAPLIHNQNQYLLPVVLMTDAAKYVLTQGLAYMLHQQYYQNDWSGLFAAVTMIMVPTLLVYVIFQQQIQKGITVGALKG